eukprot:4517037-Prymnesium_polylepis.1
MKRTRTMRPHGQRAAMCCARACRYRYVDRVERRCIPGGRGVGLIRPAPWGRGTWVCELGGIPIRHAGAVAATTLA